MTFKLSALFTYVLVFARTTTVIALMPVFGRKNVPPQVKVLFGLALSVLVTMGLSGSTDVTVSAGASIVVLVIREVFIGIVLGTVASFIFHAVEYAGELAGMQMGFAIAGILDPQSGQRVSVIGKCQGVLVILLFLGINGHYFVLKALLDSLQVLPVGEMGVNIGVSMSVLQLASKVFVIALQVAAPATILLLLVNVGLGVVARMVPQMNVFIVGFPLMITVGIVMFIISMPAFVRASSTMGRKRHLPPPMAIGSGRARWACASGAPTQTRRFR